METVISNEAVVVSVAGSAYADMLSYRLILRLKKRFWLFSHHTKETSSLYQS
jgi:hypothetical protein